MTADRREKTSKATLDNDIEEIRSVLSAGESPEPPDLLDQAVLNSARRAIEENNRPRRFSLRWLGVFATASVVVLALGIVVQQEQESTPEGTSEVDHAKLKKEAPAREQKMAVDKQLLMEIEGRDAAARSRAAPMAAPPAARFSATELVDQAADAEEELADVKSPEEWISHLLWLQSTDQQTLLSEELTAFRAAYPDHSLPPELSDVK